MQQRQLRLGDILDDYCPRERRRDEPRRRRDGRRDVKQTRCTTCDAEHEYKHAKVPRQRRKTESPAALYAQVLAGGPKRVAHEARRHRRRDEAADEPRPVGRQRGSDGASRGRRPRDRGADTDSTTPA